VIISFVVALLTAPVNLIVDFLFVEVISAPTADSLKKESLSSSRLVSRSFAQAFRGGASDAANKAPKTKSKSKSKATNHLGREESRKSENWTDMITTTRVIPPRTREAHDEAMECANAVIEDAKSRQDRRLTQTKSRHEAFSTRFHKSIRYRNTQKTQVSRSGSEGSWSSSLFSSRSRIRNVNPNGNGNGTGNGDVDPNDLVDVESVFRQLTDDINQQRKLLKRSQQEAFDSVWG
jgi:hypothetical protein